MVERLAVTVNQIGHRYATASLLLIPRQTQVFCWVSVGWSLNHSSYVLPLDVGLRHH
jgi:hypothetical protein